MSKYELNDDQVRRVVSGKTTADDEDDLFRQMEEQLPSNEDDNIITDDELADCDTPDETWREGGIKD